jgi:hypothetical protein
MGEPVVSPDTRGAHRAMADSVSLFVFSEPPRREPTALAKAWEWIKAWFRIDPQHPVMA